MGKRFARPPGLGQRRLALGQALDVVAEEGVAQPLVDLLNDPRKKELHEQSLKLLCILARIYPAQAKLAAAACTSWPSPAASGARNLLRHFQTLNLV